MRSRQFYYETLESSHGQFSKEFSIQLQQYSNEFGLLLSYYKTPIESKSKVTNKIVEKLVKETGLDKSVADQVYWNYQTATTQILLLNSDVLKTLVIFVNKEDEKLEYLDLLNFYHQERIATLAFIAGMFRAAQDQNHLYHNECKKVCDKWDKEGLKERLIKEWEVSRSAKLPSELEMNAPEAIAWTKQNLWEQKAYVELLILVFYSYCPNPKESFDMITSLLQFDFGSKQPNRPFFDTVGSELFQQICDLSTVLFLEMLNFELVFDRLFGKKQSSVSVLFDDPVLLQQVNTKIWDSLQGLVFNQQEPKPTGMICLGWSCFVQLLLMILAQHCPPDYKELFYQLSQNSHSKSPQKLFQFGYLQGKALDYFIRMVNSENHFLHDSNELAYKCILKGFLNIMLVTQNVGALPDRSKLVQCFSSIFKNAQPLVNHFWTFDYEFEDCKSLLETTQRSFPIYFEDFTTLVQSLIADADSADYVFQYLQQMPVFADYARASDYQQSFENVDGTNVWYWIGGQLITDAPNMNLVPPHGTPAFEIGNNVLLLKFSYSAWHLGLALLDSFLHSSTPDLEAGDFQYGSLNTTEHILKLIYTVLKHADNNTRSAFLEHLGQVNGNFGVYGDSPPEAISGLVGEIMNRCCTHSNVQIEIITGCLNIMNSLIHYYPQVIWKRLRVQRLLPQYSTSSVANPGYIQHSVIPLECSLGCYTATKAFLRLVKGLVLEAQVLTDLSTDKTERTEIEWIKYDTLYCCVLFILREIFPVYSGWKYVHIKEKFEIGLLILEILGSIMKNTSWYFMEQEAKDDSKRASLIQKLLIDIFIDNPTMYQLSPLLDIVATGNAVPLQYHAMGRRFEAELVENSIVESLKLLRQFFVILHNHDKGISGLEKAMLDRTIRMVGGSSAELLQVIATYIDYQNNADFALLATEILTILCTLSKRNGRPSTSFVGYFGGEAFTLVSKFVELVNDESKKAAYSSVVQMTVYNFVNAVIESQPGLGAMFLNGFEPKSIALKDQKIDEKEIKESSILYPLLLAMNKWEDLLKVKPPVLASMLNLLDSLWRFSTEHHATLTKLRQKTELWTNLCALLVAPHEKSSSPYYKISKAHCLRLLVTESLYIIRSSTPINSSSDKIWKTVSEAVFGSLAFGQSVFTHNQELTEDLLSLCNEIYPPINMNHFRRLTWNEVFDPERLFGSDFIYDTALLDHCLNLQQNPEIERVAVAILKQVRKVNDNWSSTHAQLSAVQQSSFAIHLITSKLFSSDQFKLEKAQVYGLIKKVIGNLKHTTQAYIHVAYKTELTHCLHSLLHYWTGMVQKESGGSEVHDQIADILEYLQAIFMVNSFPLGPAGIFSEFPFHLNTISCILLLLRFSSQLAQSPSAMSVKKMHTVYKGLLPIVCHGLYFVLAGPSSATSQDESLLLSTLFELTRPKTGAPVSLWAPILEKYRVFDLLLNSFATWEQSTTEKNLTQHPERVLQVLLSLAQHAPCVASLANIGIIATLCNNSFSSKLVEGSVQAYDGLERDPVHRIWCLKLSIVTELVHYLGNDRHFLESAIGFLRVYQEQILYAINAYRDTTLTEGLLEEIDRISVLIYSISVSLDTRQSKRIGQDAFAEYPIFTETLDHLLRLFALYVFLFKNPNELGNRIQAMSRQEKAELEGFEDVKKSLVHQRCRDRMVSITIHIASFLALYAHAESVLLGEQSLEVPALFAPTLSSFHEFGATFGTLFDLIRHLTLMLKQEYDKQSKQIVPKLICGCETTLTLVCSQLRIYETGEETDSIQELFNEFQVMVTDLNQLFNDTRGNWKGLLTHSREFLVMFANQIHQ